MSILICILISLTLSGCKKNDNTANDSIVGNWELRAEINGQTGQKNSYAAGNGMVMKFTADGYQIYQKGVLQREGTYTAGSYITKFTKEKVSRIRYDNDENPVNTYFTIAHNNILTISIDANDAPAGIYERIQ